MDKVYAKDPQRAAIAYRERGWSPIRLRGKVPSEPWAEHQHKQMSAEEITDHPWPGVGIVTGQVSGLLVLDADSPQACEELKRRGHPVTPIAKTARGLHLYFKHPGGELPTRLGLGEDLDLKGDGGYVAAPPTRHPSGVPYEWIIPPEEAEPAELPAWVMEQVQLRARSAGAEDLGGEEIPNGSRNKTLTSIAGSLRRRGLDEATILAALLGVNTAKCKPPLDVAEVEGIAASVARYAPAEPAANGVGTTTRGAGQAEYRLTDLGNAQRFVRDHGSNVRYCYPWGKWLVWDGKRWAVDTSGEVERLMKATVRSMYAEAGAVEDDKERKALVDHAKRSESKARITDALYLTRSEPGVAVAPDQLDADPWLFNTASGTINLRSGELHKHRRKDLITKLAPVEYDPQAEAPRFEQFISEVFSGDEGLIGFVQRFAGYSLTGSTEERAFAILYGSGKNGKTTLVELLRDALGDYARNTDTETVLRKRHAGIGNDVAALKGARFVSAAEVEKGRALAESKVKNLTGTDTVTARFLFAEPFDFRPEFKLWLSTNNKPVIHGTDDAIWDRIRLIPFTQRFAGAKADRGLPRKLREELPGVLAWMVRGCTEWQRGGLGESEQVAQATQSYRAEMDTLAAFIEDRCVVQQGVRCKFADLYAAYVEWCGEYHEHAESRRRFADSLTERGHKKDTGAGGVKIRWDIALRHNGGPEGGPEVTDPSPEDAPGAPEDAPEAEKIGNPVTDPKDFGNPQNTCKTGESDEGVTDSYQKNRTFQDFSSRGEGSGKTVTNGNFGNFGNSGGEKETSHEGQPGGWFGTPDKQQRSYQDTAAMLEDPPGWLAEQISMCHAEPERWLRPTAATISYELYGNYGRVDEVIQVLQARIDEEVF